MGQRGINHIIRHEVDRLGLDAVRTLLDDMLGLVEVRFVDWLRPELRFDGREALVQAIDGDVALTRQRLAAAPPEA